MIVTFEIVYPWANSDSQETVDILSIACSEWSLIGQRFSFVLACRKKCKKEGKGLLGVESR